MRTDLLNDLVVFQNAPADVNAIVVPVCARHLLVDVGVDASHGGGSPGGAAGKGLGVC